MNPCNGHLRPLPLIPRIETELLRIAPRPEPLPAVPRSEPTGREMVKALHRIEMFLEAGQYAAARCVTQNILRQLEGGE